MNEPFNVNQYWLERGRTYAAEERLALEYHRVQERHLLQSLAEAGLGDGKILELGCGFGRITRLLSQEFPSSQITAVDLSPDQLANAKRHCEGCKNVAFHGYDFYSGEPFPGGSHDVAVAIEVFLHHPPEIIRSLLERLRRTVKAIVHLDWFEAWSGPLPPHVWIHDYPAYFRNSGWNVAALPVPAKVEGKQQVLFVAAQELPDSLREFACRQTSFPIPDRGEDQVGGVIKSWEHQVAEATSDICRVVPPGETVVLIGAAEWGITSFADRRIAVPLMQRDGLDWGAPSNDAEAWEGLEARRREGATWLVLGWNAFWWLDCYRDWFERVRQSYRCVLKNDRVVVFHLKNL